MARLKMRLSSLAILLPLAIGCIDIEQMNQQTQQAADKIKAKREKEVKEIQRAGEQSLPYFEAQGGNVIIRTTTGNLSVPLPASTPSPNAISSVSSIKTTIDGHEIEVVTDEYGIKLVLLDGQTVDAKR